jgi:hypothetical protein
MPWYRPSCRTRRANNLAVGEVAAPGGTCPAFSRPNRKNVDLDDLLVGDLMRVQKLLDVASGNAGVARRVGGGQRMNS